MNYRLLLISSLLLVCLFTSEVAVADTNCNTFSFTFSQVLGQSGTFFENGATDCISVLITDRTISSEFSIVVNESGILSDSLNFTNTGPNGTLDICFMSFNDGGAGTSSCSLAANVTTFNYGGDPAIEQLSSGNIFDVPTGIVWSARLISTDNPLNGTSDTLFIGTPEPSSMLLLGTGVLGVASLLRRKLMV
jgi:hypothetical protein